MLKRTHVEPFLRVRGDRIELEYLADESGRVVPFLDRLCRLTRRLEGWPRVAVAEALRRQERHVRDAARLSGLSRALLDACVFKAPEGAERAEEVRAALFGARGKRWPPVPGDRSWLLREAAVSLDVDVEDVDRLLYADAPGAQVLVRAPAWDGRTLLAHYNLELARAVLLDASRLELKVRGGWRDIFRAVKSGRVMHELHREGRSYRMEITGPAAQFVVRPARYGARLARVIPALSRSPAWRLEADIVRDGRRFLFTARGSPRARGGDAPVGSEPRRARYDSGWERSLAAEFRKRVGKERDGWSVHRESTPVRAGGELFLPDFTFRHEDGREALVEIVGFWTPEYLESKVRKVAAAGLENLVLVVYRGLAVGGGADVLEGAVGEGRVVWFSERPRAGEVMRAVERWGV